MDPPLVLIPPLTVFLALLSPPAAAYGIKPGQKTVPPPQGAQLPICLNEDVLSHVLGVMEIAEPYISKRVDTRFVLVNKQAKGLRLSIEAFPDDIPIFRSHFIPLS